MHLLKSPHIISFVIYCQAFISVTAKDMILQIDCPITGLHLC